PYKYLKTSPSREVFKFQKNKTLNPILFENIFIFVLRTTKNKMMIFKNNPAFHAQTSGTIESHKNKLCHQQLPELKNR
ncbi:hypothetical protein, partial [Chryseobacterium piscium]|uniref:hypothetical protein n=1 Tax=Chryseobacterium piscium TaxID=333702 RepID=UPI0019D41690